MSLLEMPQAVALLEDVTVPIEAVTGVAGRLTGFLQRYLPRFYRLEQRELASLAVAGRLSELERKTSEPIARQAGRGEKPLQHFVGAGKWDDAAVTAELRQDVAEVWGEADAVLVFDGSAFPKKGADSCGVARQWCGRLGKIENCQVGVFTSYVTSRGAVLVDRQLYLPEEWAADAKRRHKTHVPEDVVFAEKWRLALEQWQRCRDLPHAWVAADDEFGRVTAFRLALRRQRVRYVLDVPCNTLSRDLEGPRTDADGRRRLPAWERVDDWAARQPAAAWTKRKVRDGEQGEYWVWALSRWVQTKDEDGCVGRSERLLVVRPVGQAGETQYALSNASGDVPLADLVQVKCLRPRMEQALQEGKGEAGLGQYEVRSWAGWHHHMTLSMLALWFLCLERMAIEKKRRGSRCRKCG
jgi:SRSO17 transposase